LRGVGTMDALQNDRWEDAVTTEQVVLRLDGGCIETAARRELQRLIVAALAAPGDPEVDSARQIALLGEFVRTADFRALRATRPELAGDHDLEVSVRLVPGVGYEVEVLDRVEDGHTAEGRRQK